MTTVSSFSKGSRNSVEQIFLEQNHPELQLSAHLLHDEFSAETIQNTSHTRQEDHSKAVGGQYLR